MKTITLPENFTEILSVFQQSNNENVLIQLAAQH